MKLPAMRSLYGTVGLPMILFTAVWVLLAGLGFLSLERVRGDVATVTYLGRERIFYQLLYLTSRLPGRNAEETATLSAGIRSLTERGEKMLDALIDGDPALGIPGVDDPEALALLEESRQNWTARISPAIDGVLSGGMLSSVVVENLESLMRAHVAELERQANLIEEAAGDRLERARLLLLASAAVILIGLITILAIVRHVARRTRALVETAEDISAGNLARRAPANGVDELALLGSSFNTMTDRLSAMLESERDDRARLESLVATISLTAQRLSASTAEILAGTSQQVEGMREQSSAVTQTATSVDEVLQTAEQATRRAEEVAASSETAVAVSGAGRKAVEETVTVMNAVSQRTEAIAGDILALAESGQEIGEIVAAVTEITDQTNLLALNAAIEASRAGEHGHGFSVVAAEIKALADQSKTATSKVRRILLDIQTSTNAAVIGMEEGARSVSHALEKVSQAGDTIRQLEGMIADAARSAAQIAASAGQQRAGMKQIHDAMHHIEQTSSQNLAAVRQAEQAARDLNALGTRLKAMLDGYGS